MDEITYTPTYKTITATDVLRNQTWASYHKEWRNGVLVHDEHVYDNDTSC